MSIKSEEKKLAITCGNQCAFRGCNAPLTIDGPGAEKVVTGEIAHIVGDSRQGPRGRHTLSDRERDLEPNLIYLCEKHHKLVDALPETFSVAVLRQMKADHLERLRKLSATPIAEVELPFVEETLHATLLRVACLPAAVYAAPCAFGPGEEAEVAKRIQYPADGNELCPFLLRDKKIFAFHTLTQKNSPFGGLIDVRRTERIDTQDFLSDPEGRRRLVSLLNSALRRFLCLRNIAYDKLHKRYYFRVQTHGEAREESYQTITGRSSSRNVVWQPRKKATNEPKNHWLHLAAGLGFIHLADQQWGFSIRLERHITIDGETPFPSEQVGPKVTRLKAKMRNAHYLQEVQFWRDFLSHGKPRFILKCGDQSCIVESEFASSKISWPGIEGDEKPFTNLTYEDDLFSLGEWRNATSQREDLWDLEREDEDDEE